jgi:DNA modification methylase
MEPYWTDGKATLYHGDCLAVLRELPSESVHCCVSSPPYWGLRDYGVKGQLGLEATPEEYVAKMVDVFREVRRVLRSDSVMFLNIGDSYAGGGQNSGSTPDKLTPKQRSNAGCRYDRTPVPSGMKPKDLVGIPWMLAFALRADGWYLRSEIVWHKPNVMPESVSDRPTKSHEQVFLLTKNARYFYDAEAVKEPASENTNLKISKSEYARIEAARAEGAKTTEAGGVSKRKRHDFDGMVKANESFENANCLRVDSRNLRSVWTIPTSPFPGAHFATFPPELAKRCILAGTSAEGCCSACLAPWERVVDAEPYQARGEYRKHAGESGHNNPSGKTPGSNTRGMPDRNKTTTGWRPTCQCSAGEPVPCTVLDPFGGSGTTADVARKNGCKAILIELNEEYLKLQIDRLKQRTLL